MVRIALGLIMLAAGLVNATTFVVSPGPGTPIQDAIDTASPGDTVRLTAGEFAEHIVIGKRLKLRGVDGVTNDPNRLTRVSGGCTAGPLVSITADDVQVRDVALHQWVDGGVSIVGRTRVKVKGVFAIANCAPPINGSPFNIENSTRVTLDHIWGVAFGTVPSAIRIAGTPQGGRVKLKKSIAGSGDSGGILLENNGINAVRVSSNDSFANVIGIHVVGTSRAIIDHNRIGNNSQSGIQIDAGSSGNLIIANTIGQSGIDVIDNGAANCWKNNTFGTGTVPPCP